MLFPGGNERCALDLLLQQGIRSHEHRWSDTLVRPAVVSAQVLPERLIVGIVYVKGAQA